MGNYASSELATEQNVNDLTDGALVSANRFLKTTNKKIIYDDTNKKPIVKKDVEGVAGAFILENVLTAEECEQFIKITEDMGYDIAPVSVGENVGQVMTDVRDNKRVMWDTDAEVLEPIWNRIKDHLDQTIPSPTNSGDWVLKGLNERLRFYRYAKEQQFRPHFDGAFRRSDAEKSHLSFLIYLNDGFEGGYTTFFPGRISTFRDPSSHVRVNPVQGSALLFFHVGGKSPMHEGSPHFSDNMHKYVLRSDIMYYSEQRKRPPVKIDDEKQGKDRETQETEAE